MKGKKKGWGERGNHLPFPFVKLKRIRMFWKKEKLDTKMVANIIPTSKASLKRQCLIAAKYNVEEAEKLYNFMIKDMEELPMMDIVPPSTMQQIKEGAVQTFSWINQNQDQIINWVGIIREMFGGGGATMQPPAAAAPVPPIN